MLFPPEMETAEYWEGVMLDAQAERLIRRIEQGMEPEPGWWEVLAEDFPL